MALELKPLILAGGRSTRMGSPKHLLQFPDGTPLYQHQVKLLRQALPSVTTIYMSLAKDSQLDTYLQNADDHNIKIIYDTRDNHDEAQSGGPAQGLLAAHEFDPKATWLVLAVDYPLLTVDLLQQLQDAYQPPVTCFRNGEGYCEPLLGIWSPEALRRLQDNLRQGRSSGPSAVVRQLGGHQIDPETESDRVLMNVNAQADWDKVVRLLFTSKAYP
ncbi:bifunctional molybdenum cofactor biosynthesis protein [Trichoderma longibrachiatum]|uniref:Nucleotide-diphospho-sugar transferase n=1 Tax=Trichoderma longibrachiatum ATCC 18648 TaxID=983965 RepID=A0A2T4BPR5_TRILO|nr:nucleotide-diphospho-sugar transferase [Trichoderma longibrachiatum ATCC 18648]